LVEEEFVVKIAVTAIGNTLDSQLDQRFGRANYFIIVDSDSLGFEAVNNAAVATSAGAGIVAAQAVAEHKVEALITGYVGPNALSVLQAAEIKIYQGQSGSVRENIEQFQKGELEKVAGAVPAHFGQGQST
jgi:predicted Fe-Mo cluster-binding NifX family protein